jgi:hypothetical protein
MSATLSYRRVEGRTLIIVDLPVPLPAEQEPALLPPWSELPLAPAPEKKAAYSEA